MGDMPMTSLIIERSGAVLPDLKGYLNAHMSNHSKYILPRRLFDDESLKRNTHTPLETFAIGAASDHAQATHPLWIGAPINNDLYLCIYSGQQCYPIQKLVQSPNPVRLSYKHQI
jgi:hypothetical protein